MEKREPTPYLTIVRIDGDPPDLLAAYRRASETMDGVGRDHDLILHAAAPTEAGLLIVNLWPSKDDSDSAARDPRRLGAVKRNGLAPDRIHHEHATSLGSRSSTAPPSGPPARGRRSAG